MPCGESLPIPDEPILHEYSHTIQTWCVLHRLVDELTVVQQRLWISLGQQNDHDQVRELEYAVRIPPPHEYNRIKLSSSSRCRLARGRFSP